MKNHLNDLNKIHPRELEVEKMKNELTGLVLKVRDKNNFTMIEYLQWLTSEMTNTLKYMLRFERHGNYDKPAGLE